MTKNELKCLSAADWMTGITQLPAGVSKRVQDIVGWEFNRPALLSHTSRDLIHGIDMDVIERALVDIGYEPDHAKRTMTTAKNIKRMEKKRQIFKRRETDPKWTLDEKNGVSRRFGVLAEYVS